MQQDGTMNTKVTVDKYNMFIRIVTRRLKRANAETE
jgi:hypothetical protein